MVIYLLIFMFLAHVIDDYVLQAPCLCNLKQRSWWEKVAPDKKYKYDYLAGLFCHAMSWAIMICLPIIVYSLVNNIDLQWFYLAVPANLAIHALVDDIKANRHKINLIVDQSIHFVQIIVTWLVFVLIFIK